MERRILTFKSDEYITDRLATKLKVEKERYKQTAEKYTNAEDADEQAKIITLLYEIQSRMETIYKEALSRYIADVGTDKQKIYDDVDFMLSQIDYELIVQSYSTHVALNSLELSKKRIMEMEDELIGSFSFTVTDDDINEENIEKIIDSMYDACITRYLVEQFEILERNFKGDSERELIEQTICMRSVDRINALISETAGNTETLIKDLKAKIVTNTYEIEKAPESVDADAIQIEATIDRELISIPTSRELHLVSSIISNRHNLPAYIDKKNTANKNKLLSTQTKGVDPIEYKTGDNEYKKILVKGKESITIALPDMQKPIKNNRPASNMFTFLLPQIEKQAFNNGVLYAEHISFNLQELVDIGMYSDIRSARRGNETAAEALKGIEVQAKNDAGAFVLASVFPTIDKTENNICTYHINPQINWTNLLKYHYQLPKYYFSLPTKAQDLLNNLVAYLARQNAAQVKDKGFFTISLRQVQAELNLPDEHKTKDVNGKIKKPIAEAIKDINDADGGKYYKLELHVNKNAKPSQYLDTGYIRVFPLNEVKEHIISVLDKRNKIIENNAKKIESRKVKALAKAYKEGKTDEDILGGNE